MGNPASARPAILPVNATVNAPTAVPSPGLQTNAGD
jgi:hypothetical protein